MHDDRRRGMRPLVYSRDQLLVIRDYAPLQLNQDHVTSHVPVCLRSSTTVRRRRGCRGGRRKHRPIVYAAAISSADCIPVIANNRPATHGRCTIPVSTGNNLHVCVCHDLSLSSVDPPVAINAVGLSDLETSDDVTLPQYKNCNSSAAAPKSSNLINVCVKRHESPTPRHLTFGCWNVRSANAKIDEIIDVKSRQQLDVLLLTETWHENESISIKRLRSEGFQLLERARRLPEGRDVESVGFVNHGGVAIAASSGVKLTSISIGSPKSFECICSRITTHAVSCVLLLIYRPGSKPATSAFFDELTSVLERLSVMSAPIVVTGDVNIRLDRPDDPLSRKFTDVLDMFGLVNHVTVPTQDMGGMLDVMVTRQEYAAGPVQVLDVGHSDHRLIKWSMDLQPPAPRYETVTRRQWKQFRPDDFKTELRASVLCESNHYKSLDGEKTANMYNTEITAILDRMLPVSTVTRRKRPSDLWCDEEYRQTRRHVRRLERHFNRSGNNDDRAIWRTNLRDLRQMRKRKQSAFWVGRIESERFQPRKLWQSVDTLLSRQKAALDTDITAAEFHNFFDQKVADVRSSTDGAGAPDYGDCSCSMPFFQPLTVEEILHLIQSTPNKQCVLDPLPTWLLKDSAVELAPFITHLVNSSMSDGAVPDIFKTAVICPRMKKPTLDASDVKSYRPISNLPVMSKLLERAVSKQLIAYLDANNLMPDKQSAYRACHSTETALAKVLSDIFTALDSGDISLLALLDLSAAFDTVDHHILLKRLHSSFGLSSAVLSWFTSYLCNRKQSVRCGSQISSASVMTCGVPQGSVLGPILFLLYTVPLNSLVRKSGLDSHHYADDAQIYGHCRATCVSTLHAKTERCIGEVADWMSRNRLQLNAAKTEFLWCATARRRHQIPDTPFLVGKDLVQPASVVRNLGLFLDNDLSMKQHISNLVRTCFSILRQLKTVSRSLPADTSKLLVHSFITSRIDYCNVAFAGLPQANLSRIQTVLNAAARLVCNARKFDHITPLLRDELHWLRVPERVEYKLCLLTYKCLHHLGPEYLSDDIIPLSGLSNRQRLRSSTSFDVVVPATRTKAGDRAFCVAGPRAWNGLPHHVQSAESLGRFKRQLKSFLFRKSYDIDT